MEAINHIDLKNLDKSNWQTYRFDQIANNISERVDPNNTELQVYIGLEHIDSESIHIKRSGTPDDVDGQKLRFYPGDVIFGRRRAYQRKAAIATTDGFCSAHALVLRANPEVIDPQLFPFFLHSDAFMHRAVDISVGSLSPTINWGTLKHQEFLLPPRDQQAKLAELLWAMDETIECELNLLMDLKRNIESLQRQLFDKSILLRTKLADYCFVVGGYAFPSEKFVNQGTPVIKISNIVDGRVVLNDKNSITEIDFFNIDKYKTKAGDIVIAMTGATLGKVGVVQECFEGSYINQRVGFLDYKTM